MSHKGAPDWLRWTRRLQALSQTGIHFANNPFDEERYQEIGDIAGEILQSHTGLSMSKIQQDFLFQRGYATPKVAVRGAVFKEEKILLVQELTDGLWSLPGGWADVNDPPSVMVVREVREESGYVVNATQLIGVYESNHDCEKLEFWHNYKLLFLCEIIAGGAHSGLETTGVGFFSRDALPELSPLRTDRNDIEEAYAHLYDSNRPPAFD